MLCMSGYPERTGGQAVDADAWNAWLEKPFTPDGLMLKVRESLTR